MELINYDNLYNEAVVDFSNQIGLYPHREKRYNLEDYLESAPQQPVQEYQASSKETTSKETTGKKENYSQFKGFEQFSRIYDKVQAYNPDASRYRKLLTKIASLESGFRPGEVNRIGAAGYFQFMDNTRIGIMKKLGKTTNKQTFLNNLELQILAAIELAKEFENSFTTQDIQKAYQKGHTLEGLISGAWLGGAGGVRRYLNKGIDSSDGGTTVSKRIKIGDSL